MNEYSTVWTREITCYSGFLPPKAVINYSACARLNNGPLHQMPHCQVTRPQSSVIPDVGNEMVCTIRLRPSNIVGYGDPETLFQVVNRIESDDSGSHLCLTAVKPWTKELSLPLIGLDLNPA